MWAIAERVALAMLGEWTKEGRALRRKNRIAMGEEDGNDDTTCM